MKKRRVIALLMVLAMVLACFSGREMMKAADGDNIIVPVAGTSMIYTMAAGETKHVVIPVRLASWEYTVDTASIIVMVESDDNLFEMTEAILTRENVPSGDPVGLNSYQVTNVEFDLKVKDTAKIGPHTGKVKFYLSGTHYTEYSTETIPSPVEIPFTIRVNREKAPIQLVVDNFKYDEQAAAVGSNFTLEFDAKNEGEIAALNTYMSIDYGSSGIVPNYSVKDIKIGDMKDKASSHQSLSVRVLPDAKPGMYPITVNYTYKNADGDDGQNSCTLYVNIIAVSTAASDDAKLTAQAIRLNDEVEVNNPYNVVVSVENIGKQTAKNIVAKVAEEGGIGASTGILPDYATTGVSGGSLKAGGKIELTLPLSVTKSASAGLHELSVQVSYEDSKGNTVTTVGKVYLTVLVPEKQEVKNDVVISQMTQEPAAPMPGDILTVNFLVTNNGSNDIKDLQIAGDGLSSNGFEPLTADVKHEIGDLAVGDSQQVTMQFRLGSGIPEGMNELKLVMDYVDAEGASQSEPKTVYILNVTKETEEQVKNNIEITNISQNRAT
ncbi:MAG: hypothetical protein K2N63_03255, partial [Lachnospiraceae bacterium]|nr:hypothetical protein [Lachnospiraceae bacterium]